MSHIKLFKSSRLFLQLGIGVILLAIACLPAKARVVNGVDLDIIYMGPILTLLIAAWSFPSLVLATIESSMSKKSVLLGFTPILPIVNIFLALMIWQYVRFPYSDIAPFLAPCIAADIIALSYFVTDQKVANTLKNPKVRTVLILTLSGFPILAVVGSLVQGTIFY